jgi:hypothetical protein
MVRFLCISNGEYSLIQMLLTPQRKHFFRMGGTFYCKILANSVKTSKQAFVPRAGGRCRRAFASSKLP